MRVNIKDWVVKEKESIKKSLEGKKNPPHLLVLQVGNEKDSNSYISGKWKDCQDTGIDITLVKISPRRAATEIRKYLAAFMHKYDGIILQEPSGLTENEKQAFLKMIGKHKDVDGFRVDSDYSPCTPEGIMRIIEIFYEGTGNIVTVVGRGELVGKPLIPMLVDKGFTVLCANSRTPDLKALTSMSDIVVSATGVRNLITRDMLKDNAFVIDAGITFDENGKIGGDCDKSIYDDETIQITTVPGGVGLMTRLMLVINTLNSWAKNEAHQPPAIPNVKTEKEEAFDF